MKLSCCLYPGSFDPVTLGHMDIIRRAARIFDVVYVGVLCNPDKKGCFPIEKRVDMLKKACYDIPEVQVLSYNGLLARLTEEKEIPVVVRGVRGVSDLESESAMARINHHLNPNLDTFFLPASSGKEEISGSMVRQLAAFGADLSNFVPCEVLPDILAAFSKQ